MKKVILLALLMPYPAFGQIIENFESQSLSNWIQSSEGHWSADTTLSLSGAFSLHQIFDNPDAGIDRIGIRTSNLHPGDGTTSWSFRIRYGYDPSSMNNWAVFLMSDSDPGSMALDGSTKGYAIGVNLTGSDDSLRLWKLNGSTASVVVNCRINWQEDIGITNDAKISVERTITGAWTVKVSNSDGDNIGTSVGSDPELFDCSWFGIFYKYSSTKDRLIWFDDLKIEGSFHTDLEAPVISKCEVSGKNSVDILLNEQPSEGSLQTENFLLNDEDNKVISVTKINDLLYHLVFSDDFESRHNYTLTLNELCDLQGNCSENTKITFKPSWAGAGDIVISEIMADPSPSVSLPEEEFIEITNRTDYSFNLTGWTLSTESSQYAFPETSINSGSTVILCSENDTAAFARFGKTIGFSQFPSLTDAGRILYVSDQNGNFIHGLEYSDKWYNDELKSNGGWSLEIMNIAAPFLYEGNWKASVSKAGGTPGRKNSAAETNPDITFYGIQNVFPIDSVTLHIKFSEPVLNFAKNPEIITIENKAISDVYASDPLLRGFTVKLKDPLQRNMIYQFRISGSLKDFAENAAIASDFSFGMPETAVAGDVLFNEILFNAFPGYPDYIELYNFSEKIIDANRLETVSVSAESDTSLPVFMWDEGRCLLPHDYFAVTTDRAKVLERYFSSDPGNLYEKEALPSMADDKGHLVLYSRELVKIDELNYSDDMQFQLLADFEGVALEKINPGKKSDEISAWHSASESSGWGTPGAPNSVFVEAPAVKDEVVLSSTKITPDNDGFEDFLTIDINPTGAGNVVSITVYDETGSHVRKLASNLYAGAGTSIIWDGTGDDGSFVNTGIYIVFISIFDDTGKTNKWKKVCTVIR